MQYLDCKKISENIYSDLKERLGSLSFRPTLAVILASDDEPSRTYVNLKRQKAMELGIETQLFKFENITSNTKDEIIECIRKLNSDRKIDGVLIQLPLDEKLTQFKSEIIDTLDPSKDVDGLTSISLGSLVTNRECFLSATADAVLESIKATNRENLDFNEFISSKNIVIINNSTLIGKPLFEILSTYNATVTVLNKYTKDLKQFTSNADILITATGQTKLIDYTMVKNNCTIIDVTSVKKNGKVIGDVIISKELEDKINWITPVPGGIGPLTITCLLRNLVRSAENK
jgi:methylenetetrahydrofolate dehydrogenase (NADP+)/methenyltetrahydrofolate cyclohydrolase